MICAQNDLCTGYIYSSIFRGSPLCRKKRQNEVAHAHSSRPLIMQKRFLLTRDGFRNYPPRLWAESTPVCPNTREKSSRLLCMNKEIKGPREIKRRAVKTVAGTNITRCAIVQQQRPLVAPTQRDTWHSLNSRKFACRSMEGQRMFQPPNKLERPRTDRELLLGHKKEGSGRSQKTAGRRSCRNCVEPNPPLKRPLQQASSWHPSGAGRTSRPANTQLSEKQPLPPSPKKRSEQTTSYGMYERGYYRR